MFTPLFDGQFRSKRTVSLRGASKQGELSESLVSKIRRERDEREKDRLRTSSAITIQAYYRGYTARKVVHKQLRRCFDSGSGLCTSPAHIYKLSTQLLIFYQEDTDHERLVLLCQKWVQLRTSIQKDLQPSNTSEYPFKLLSRILTICLQSLSHTPQQVLSGPLRLLDIYTTGNNCRQKVLEFVLKKGYYRTLRKLIEDRIPSPDSRDTPLLPLATSLIEYVIRPIKSLTPGYSEYLLTELLAPPLSPHLCYMIIPELERCGLDLLHMLKVIGLSAPPTPTLCYFIMQLVHKNSDSLSEESVTHLLSFISRVMESLSNTRDNGRASVIGEGYEEELLTDIEGEDDEMDEEIYEEDMEYDPIDGPVSLTHCIIDQISNGPLVELILKHRNRSASFLSSVCTICYHVLSLSNPNAMFRHKLLISLALSPALLHAIWDSILTMTLKRTYGPSVNVLDMYRHGTSSLSSPEAHSLLYQLSTFAVFLHVSLSSLHDIELFTKGPFPLAVLGTISLKLRDVFVNLNMNLLHTSSSSMSGSAHYGRDPQRPKNQDLQLLSNSLYYVLKSLFNRNSRLMFCPNSSWDIVSLDNIPVELFYTEDEGDDEESRPQHPSSVYKQVNLLKKAPFVFKFLHRFKFFHKLVTTSRLNRQGRHQEFLIGPSISITARRTHLYEDAFSKLATEDLRKRLRVQLINEQGLDEAGIDGGGLFREFLSETLKSAFDPNRGFFTTTKEGYLYPNPNAHLINEDHALHYRFLGALLGKALLEQMMVELPFAPFFLSKLTSGGRGWVDIHHLGSLDPELYHHLLWLKNYKGDFDELDLDFTTVSQEFGHSRVIELKPNGGSIKVTSDNSIKYIHALANYHLNRRIDHQFRSFREGLDTVIPIQWLYLFNQSELQTLISGTEEPINMEELKKYTTYSGSYKVDHECIVMFWDIVSEFTEVQKRQLLKFVTSCSRPPLLGFKELHPPFSILSVNDTDHLPSASTCMNVLKLPMFKNRTDMKDKLIYAISSGAGFELS